MASSKRMSKRGTTRDGKRLRRGDPKAKARKRTTEEIHKNVPLDWIKKHGHKFAPVKGQSLADLNRYPH